MKHLHSSFFFLLMSTVCAAAQDQTAAEKAAFQSFKAVPSYFIANTASQKTGKRLVDDPQVSAWVQTQNGPVLFTPSGAYIGMALPDDPFRFKADDPRRPKNQRHHALEGKTRTVVIKAGFSSARAKARQLAPRLEEPTLSRVHYLVGSKENWRTDIPTYGKLVYDDVWDGITLEYLGFMDHLALQLVLEPGSDPNQIAMETGGEELELTADGRLIVSLAGAELVLSAPHAYQNIGGVKKPVAVAFKILDDRNIGFSFGKYAPKHGLVIDPIMAWSTFLGGSDNERSYGIAVDSAGNAYVAGNVLSTDYPTTSGAYDQSPNGNWDVFVSKLNSTGTALSYSTYLGGSDSENVYGIAVDPSGNAYVTGFTPSVDYPTTSGAYDETFNGAFDAFVSKLNSTGTALSYSTYLGGSGPGGDYGYGIAVDAQGNAYVTGITTAGYPITSGAYDETFNGAFDAFVTKLNSTGTALIYSTYLGGEFGEISEALAVDADGNAYVAGRTESVLFPTTSGAYDQSLNGSADVYVTKLNSTGTALAYSTLLGGTDLDECYGVALDPQDNAYVTGYTLSADYPTTSGAYDRSFNGDFDLFVSKLNSSGTTLSYSTFLGGSSIDVGTGVAVDPQGNAYVTGYTLSTNYPTTNAAYDETHGGSYDVLVSKLNRSGTALSYSTFIGGESYDQGAGIALGNSGQVYVTGWTGSSGYVTTNGAYDQSHNGNSDAIVSKLIFCAPPLWPEPFNVLDLIHCFP